MNLPSNSKFTTEFNKIISNQEAISLPLKVVSDERVFFLGYSGGTSQEANTIEISEDFASNLELPDGITLEVSLQYTFRHLKKIEFEPLTPDDYDTVRHFSEEIEENLLNQVGVFFNGMLFTYYAGRDSHYKVRLKVNISNKVAERAEWFMLGINAQISVLSKIRGIDDINKEEQKKKKEEEEKRELDKKNKRKVFIFK